MANQFQTATLATPNWAPAPAGVSARARVDMPLVLLLAFLGLTFVGTHPMADVSAGARADGDVLDRVASLSLLALAATQIWGRRKEAATLALRNLGLFAVLGFCAASILWSDHPALTLRRSALLCIMAVIAFAAALTAHDLRRLHTRLFAAMTAIILINIAATLAFPGRAVSALGVQGLYTQKNVAGSVAIVAAMVAATWIVGASGWRAKSLGYLALVPILGFLFATRSKTSINLAALGLGVVVIYALAERYGAKLVLALAALVSVLLAAALVWLAIYDFDVAAATADIVGDASFTGREELWAFVRRDAERRLWLGHGYGAYWDVGQGADPLLRAEVGSWLASVETGVINQAHHGYLELWLHIGLPATILAGLVVGARALRGAHAALFAWRSLQWRAFTLCMTLVLALNMLHNLTEATMFMRGAQMWTFAMLAFFALATAFRQPQEGRA